MRTRHDRDAFRYTRRILGELSVTFVSSFKVSMMGDSNPAERRVGAQWWGRRSRALVEGSSGGRCAGLRRQGSLVLLQHPTSPLTFSGSSPGLSRVDWNRGRSIYLIPKHSGHSSKVHLIRVRHPAECQSTASTTVFSQRRTPIVNNTSHNCVGRMSLTAQQRFADCPAPARPPPVPVTIVNPVHRGHHPLEGIPSASHSEDLKSKCSKGKGSSIPYLACNPSALVGFHACNLQVSKDT